jgi:hypothetical protein
MEHVGGREIYAAQMDDMCILSTKLLQSAANVEETAYKLYRAYCLKWRCPDASTEPQQLLSDMLEEFRLVLSHGQNCDEDAKMCLEAQIRAVLRVQKDLPTMNDPASDSAQDAVGELGHFDTAHSAIVDILLQSIKLRKDAAAKDASKCVLENCVLLVENVQMALQTHTRERDVFEHGTFVLFKRLQQQNIVLMKRNAEQLKLIDDLQNTIQQQQEQIAKIQENEAFYERMHLAFSEHRKKQKGSAGDM